MEMLARGIKERLPNAEISLDPPSEAGGAWWLDVRMDGRSVVVEWRPRVGFGVSSTPSDGYGEGQDELYDTTEGALARIVEVLEEGVRTQPPDEHVLKRLREARGASQIAIAELMGVRQATISKIERRRDLNVGTLRRFVEALGGVLEVSVRFPDGTVPLDLGQHDDTATTEQS
ncbi:helix-turn-helix domain-containing protein [Sorangium cellulosum]|nr:helix-turn-helix transcriptional regulator [Sorangium cellulosum]